MSYACACSAVSRAITCLKCSLCPRMPAAPDSGTRNKLSAACAALELALNHMDGVRNGGAEASQRIPHVDALLGTVAALHTVSGVGAHRQWQYSLAGGMQACQQQAAESEPQASVLSAELRLVQAIPPELFFDPYEVARMRLERTGSNVAVHGPVDVERCASAVTAQTDLCHGPDATAHKSSLHTYHASGTVVATSYLTPDQVYFTLDISCCIVEALSDGHVCLCRPAPAASWTALTVASQLPAHANFTLALPLHAKYAAAQAQSCTITQRCFWWSGVYRVLQQTAEPHVSRVTKCL